MGRKLERELRPLFGEGGTGSPSSTMWPGPLRPTCMSSAILIHPGVWPQLTQHELSKCWDQWDGRPWVGVITLSAGDFAPPSQHNISWVYMSPCSKRHFDPHRRVCTAMLTVGDRIQNFPSSAPTSRAGLSFHERIRTPIKQKLAVLLW